MTCESQSIAIQQGKTFNLVVRWQTTPIIYKAITAITKAAPVQVTAVAHGLTNGWPAAIVSAGGMRQINAKNWPLRDSDFHAVTVLTADTLSINDINSSEYTTYTSGGSLAYYTPVTLASYTARMQIRASVESTTTLLSLTTENSRIAIDNTLKTITLTISATDTAALTFLDGVYDLELVSSGGTVTQLLQGLIIVKDEVTR